MPSIDRSSSPASNQEWEVYVINDDTRNAFVLPGMLCSPHEWPFPLTGFPDQVAKSSFSLVSFQYVRMQMAWHLYWVTVSESVTFKSLSDI